MGRSRSLELKKIDDDKRRQIAFSKRRNALFEKGEEIAILCDSQVAIIVFSNTNRKYEFVSTNSTMDTILKRYMGTVDGPGPSNSTNALATIQHHQKNQQLDLRTAALLEENNRLKIMSQRLQGQDLDGLSYHDLSMLEQQLNEGLSSVRIKKEQVLVMRYENSLKQEEKALKELKNELLRQQVQDLRRQSLHEASCSMDNKDDTL